MDFASLQSTDISIMNTIGGNHSLFADSFMSVLTTPYTWIPFYIALLIMVIKNNETTRHIMFILFMVLVTLLCSGIADNIFIKPYFERLRPFADPVASEQLSIVPGVNDSGFSFFSAHAANTMSIAVFMAFMVRSRVFTLLMLVWSLINGYSRIYLCAHYPSDVLAGFVWGAVAGIIVYIIYNKIARKIAPVYNYVSSEYTSKGYSFGDIDMVVSIFVLTLVYGVMRAFI